jgi:hypothetical protein
MIDLENERVWVMGSGSPSAAAGNGKHYRDCPTFEVEPVVGTPEQLAALKVCSKCDRGIHAGPQFKVCPVCNTVLPASGICDQDH